MSHGLSIRAFWSILRTGSHKSRTITCGSTFPWILNKEAILRRLSSLFYHYGKANEENESEFRTDVNMLIYQIEIYDQIWFVRHMRC